MPIQMCPTEEVALHSPLPKAPGSGHEGNRIHPWPGVGVEGGGSERKPKRWAGLVGRAQGLSPAPGPAVHAADGGSHANSDFLDSVQYFSTWHPYITLLPQDRLPLPNEPIPRDSRGLSQEQCKPQCPPPSNLSPDPSASPRSPQSLGRLSDFSEGSYLYPAYSSS